ncbi:RagB/SusD family nutrient uptake outer membrane protein [Hymenobacter sp. ASUV-10]|uniref:RagB/SusD family nutrient uptake outer membrane protein n=1 Tax=Hymenobacter aranciens TaxID=3063996 RepID=A0ABT9B870_9BACT|nr:RagB/SusD family nutrient uptake outer membrane protein [Hymenobacter sp. ASUV-10]MDO7874469.1 RagB/SusD family nutrient uptake outer membrane protein [Hymenobacter sp. ASUV-10]
MKKLTLRIGLAATVLAGMAAGLTSCKDYLNVTPDSYYTGETVFSDVTGATSALIGVYDMLSGDRIYGQTVSMFLPNDADDFISSRSDGPDLVAARRQIARYIVAPTNVETNNTWISLYQGVERANICIDNIPKMAGYNQADSAALRRLHGEALTLRAQFYYELVRNWGDVPAQFQASVAGQNFNLPHADRYATYQRLLDDLLLAQRLLPWRSTAGTNNERITKGAAKALRARIALARAGYSANRENGQMQRGPDPQRDYAIARQECADLMARTGEHALNPSYLDLFKSINEQRRDVANEIIFEVAMGGSGLHLDSKLGYYNGPRHYNSRTYGNSSGAIIMAPSFFYAFDSTDTRRDVSLTPFSYGSSGTGANSPESDQQYGTTMIATTDGKFRRSWRATPLPGTLNYLGYNWPLIRYADVVLMFAEAENELNGPTDAAKEALYQIRTRAFRDRSRALASLATADLGSQPGFREAIMHERHIELSGEGIRKYDLIRWNKLSDNINDVKIRISNLRNGTGTYNGHDFANLPMKMYYRRVNGQVQWLYSFYKPSPDPAPTDPTIFSVNWRQSINDAYLTNLRPGGGGLAAEYLPGKGKELLPIPQATLDTDPALRQNFGY